MSYIYTSGSGEGVTNPGGSSTPVARPKSYFPSTIQQIELHIMIEQLLFL